MRDPVNDPDDTAARNPMEAARAAMRPQLARRFYRVVSVAAGAGGHAVLLDDRPVRTPAREALEVETAAAARLVAAEWAAQGETIDPATMPATRIVNTAIDGVAADPQAVFEDVLKFAASDLLFYRADSPRELVARQAELWDPVIDWLRDAFGANFILAEGVVHVAQPREALTVFASRLKLHDGALRLACLHTLTTLTGSALLALAIAEGRLAAEAAWAAAHVDEDWNIAQWGEDEEAARRRVRRWTEMRAAAQLLAALSHADA